MEKVYVLGTVEYKVGESRWGSYQGEFEVDVNEGFFISRAAAELRLKELNCFIARHMVAVNTANEAKTKANAEHNRQIGDLIANGISRNKLGYYLSSVPLPQYSDVVVFASSGQSQLRIVWQVEELNRAGKR